MTNHQSKSKFKRYNFSLTQAVSNDIDNISLIPRNFRCNRSDVIKAAITSFKKLSEKQKIELLQSECISDNDIV